MNDNIRDDKDKLDLIERFRYNSVYAEAVGTVRMRMSHEEYLDLMEALDYVVSTLRNEKPTDFDCKSCKHNGNESECANCYGDHSNFVKYEERPQGEWIDDNEEDSYYANCSHCGYQIDTHYERGYLNYCPNCGARMEVDNEAN